MAWPCECVLCPYSPFFGCCMALSVVLLVLECMMVLEGVCYGLEMVQNLYQYLCPLVVVCNQGLTLLLMMCLILVVHCMLYLGLLYCCMWELWRAWLVKCWSSVFAFVKLYRYIFCVTVGCCAGLCNCERVNVMWCGASFIPMLAVCDVSAWTVRTSASRGDVLLSLLDDLLLCLLMPGLFV